MKLVQEIQKLLALEGFSPDKGVFNSLELWIYLKCVCALALQYLYLFCVANSDKEYMDSIFMTTVSKNFINSKH